MGINGLSDWLMVGGGLRIIDCGIKETENSAEWSRQIIGLNKQISMPGVAP